MSEGNKEIKIRTYAFDFDGVIAEYDGFKHDFVGKPIEAVVNAIRLLKEQGHKIIIHSSRSEVILRKYCEDNNIPFDYINKNLDLEGGNPGKPIAFVYVDDRSICYRGQTTKELVEEIVNFKPHWRK